MLKQLHKSFTIYYVYFIAACLTVQQAFPEVQDYVPARIGRIIMGAATFAIFADKLRRARPKDEPQ